MDGTSKSFFLFLVVILLIALPALGYYYSPGTISQLDQTSEFEHSLTERLDKLKEDKDPGKFPYLNKQKVKKLNNLRKQLVPISPNQAPQQKYIQLSFNLFREWLFSAQYEKIIENSGTLRTKIANLPSTQQSLRSKELKWLLGQAHLRRAMSTVCSNSNNQSSCDYPLSNWDRKTNDDLRKAQKLLRELHSDNFRRKASEWLLNLIDQALSTSSETPNQPVPPDAVRLDDVAPELGMNSYGRAGSVVIEDFNDDHQLDVLVTSMGVSDGEVKLYENEGNGSFINVSDTVNLTRQIGGLNLTHADYNNDGFQDLYILRGSGLRRVKFPNSLLKNINGEKFSDVTEKAGLRLDINSTTASWRDYNNDGLLDLFVGAEDSEKRYGKNTFLFKNNGDGTFTEVSDVVGITSAGEIKGSTWGDINNDGLMDLYLSIRGNENKLYVNQGYHFLTGYHFQEQAVKRKVADPEVSFATWFWDYNNDGNQDLFVYGSNVASSNVAKMESSLLNNLESEAGMPIIYENRGDGFFKNVSEELNLPKVPNVMGANYGDINNDGRLDLLLGTGSPPPSGLAYNRLFLNERKTFREVSKQSGFSSLLKGHGIGIGDLNYDGKKEIYQSLGGVHANDRRANALFTVSETKGNWLYLKLRGTESNRDAIGARVSIKTTLPDGSYRTIHRTVDSGGSFGDSSFRLEVGLGNARDVSRVKIRWPNHQQTTQIFENLSKNNFYRMIEGKSSPEKINPSTFSLPR